MPDTSVTAFLAVLGVVAVIAHRYYAANGRDDGSRSGLRDSPREVTDDMVSVVSVLVPNVSRDAIRRDLEETRSVERTSERLLAKAGKKDASLLDKYSVADDAASAPSASSSTSAGGAAPASADWIDDRTQREERLRRQRQEMVLRARKRTLEMEQSK